MTAPEKLRNIGPKSAAWLRQVGLRTREDLHEVGAVDAFPGHIACDSASRSELVVPLRRGDAIVGVIDLDSPTPGRFDTDDRAGIESVAQRYLLSIRGGNP